MKTIVSLSLFFLFSLSSEAQSLKSNLIKTVDAINNILNHNRNAQFTNQNYALYYLTKINANLQGDVFCVDSLSAYCTKPNGIIFNLLKVKSFVIKSDEIVALGYDQKLILSIKYGSNQEMPALKKELDALLLICNTYNKLDPKFKCE